MSVTREMVEKARKADLEGLLAQWNIPVAAKGKYLRYRCPIHNGGDPNFEVRYLGPDPHGKRGEWEWRCYSRCGRGDPIRLLRIRDHLSFEDAVTQLSGQPPQQRKRVVVEPSISPPLDARDLDAVARRFFSNRVQITSTGVTAQQWWEQRSLQPTTIQRFHLGYCSRCPTWFDKDQPQATADSGTIPVVMHGKTIQIRHRILGVRENKYRPHRKNMGPLLFNHDALFVDDEGISRSDHESGVLLVEGELKAVKLCEVGLNDLMPVVSLTTGVASWLNPNTQYWRDLLRNFPKVYVLFDHDWQSLDIAEQTARLFGRRGHMLHLPGKVDDLIAADEQSTLYRLMESIASATPIRERFFFA